VNISTKKALSSKWLVIVREYELIKQGKSPNFINLRTMCNTFKVNRKDIYKYYDRWVASGKDPEALLPKKRGPKPGSMKILSKDEERTIIKIRRKFQANEFEIFHLIRGHFSVHPSVSTIYRTFKRYPLNKGRKEKIKRYEKLYPGEQLHADTHSLDSALFADRKKRFLFGLLDDCTRLCYSELIEDNRAATVTKAFFKAHKWFALHGITTEEILTDNGSEFTTYTSVHAKDRHFFETMLKIFDIRHIYTRPYRPQTNGKIERFWGIFKHECLRHQIVATTPHDFSAELNGFLYRYNYERRHSGLGHTTPLEKLKSVTEMLK